MSAKTDHGCRFIAGDTHQPGWAYCGAATAGEAGLSCVREAGGADGALGNCGAYERAMDGLWDSTLPLLEREAAVAALAALPEVTPALLAIVGDNLFAEGLALVEAGAAYMRLAGRCRGEAYEKAKTEAAP